MAYQDARISPLKSALQKFIRRGMVDEAVGVAHEMANVPGGVSALGRRLSVIVAEDVDWHLLPAVADAVRLAYQKVDPLLDVTAALAAAPKQREAYWLASLGWLDSRYLAGAQSIGEELEALTAKRFAAAILDQRFNDVAFMAYVALENSRWLGNAGLQHGLTLAAARLPAATRRVVTVVNDRIRSGGLGVHECAAGAVLAITDQLDSNPSLDVPEYDRHVEMPWPLPWWTMDHHSGAGKMALAVLRKQREVPGNIEDLWWLYESTVCYPELPSRFREESLALEARRGGWGDPEAGAAIWQGWREDIAKIDEWAIRKRVGPLFGHPG